MRLKTARVQLFIFILLFILIIFPQVFSSPYVLSIVISFLIFFILAAGLNLLVGYVGEFSFGHAAYFGIGAYSAALWTTRFEGSFWVGMVIGMLLAGIIGWLIASITFRYLTGIYFAIVTFAIAEVFRLIAMNWVSLTRGSMGIPGIPSPKIFSFSFSSEQSYYYLVLAFTILILFILKLLINSPIGRAFVSIREGNDLASSVGIDLLKYKRSAITISAVIGSISGSLYAPYFSVIGPDVISSYYSLLPLTICIVGGKGTLAGPILGASLFIIVPELLGFPPTLKMITIGLLTLFSILYMPDGLLAGFQKLYKNISMASFTKVKGGGKI